MPDDVRQILTRMKSGLASMYGPRLRGVWLFGSRARGDAALDSDLDILIALDRIEDYFQEIDRTGPLASTLSLQHGVSISRIFIAQDDWDHGDSPFLDAVRKEAVAA